MNQLWVVFGNMKAVYKIAAIAIFNFILVALIGGFAAYKINDIGYEIESISAQSQSLIKLNSQLHEASEDTSKALEQKVEVLEKEIVERIAHAVASDKAALKVLLILSASMLLIGGVFFWLLGWNMRKTEETAGFMGSCLTGLGSANVMIANMDDTIVYMNDSSRKALTDLTAEIRKQFPNFDPAQAIGSSIHIFHKDPDRIRRVLAGLKQGDLHRGTINIGDLIFTLNVGPIYARGQKIGHYAEWGDITSVRKQEAEKARIEASVKETAQKVSVASSEITEGNTNLSERTEAQAASIEETTATMQQITERVQENANTAKEAMNLANITREAADRGGQVVKVASEAMEGITASAEKISDIIGVIDEIAFQTNLLALNAAVEAARAGEQGRGFAVVAGEVRTLAGRSATAAKEIKELIQESVAKVKDGSVQVVQTQECLTDIIGNVQKVTDMVEQIASASQDQALSIGEVNKTVAQMDSFTQQNAALVEEAAAASRSLQDEAAALLKLAQGQS